MVIALCRWKLACVLLTCDCPSSHDTPIFQLILKIYYVHCERGSDLGGGVDHGAMALL